MAAAGGYGGGALSIDFGILELALAQPGVRHRHGADHSGALGRDLVLSLDRSRLYVPGRPNLGFAGQALDIWYVFIAIGVLTYDWRRPDRPLLLCNT